MKFQIFCIVWAILLTLNVVGGKLTNQVKIQFKHLFHAVLEKWCHALCIMTSSTNYLNIWRLGGVDSPADAFYGCERVTKIQGAKKFINFLQLSILIGKLELVVNSPNVIWLFPKNFDEQNWFHSSSVSCHSLLYVKNDRLTISRQHLSAYTILFDSPKGCLYCVMLILKFSTGYFWILLTRCNSFFVFVLQTSITEKGVTQWVCFRSLNDYRLFGYGLSWYF